MIFTKLEGSDNLIICKQDVIQSLREVIESLENLDDYVENGDIANCLEHCSSELKAIYYYFKILCSFEYGPDYRFRF